eukprot:gene2562-3172_t
MDNHYVEPSTAGCGVTQNQPCNSIQDGINACTTQGFTQQIQLYLAQGTYKPNTTIQIYNQSLSLIGDASEEGGASTPVVISLADMPSTNYFIYMNESDAGSATTSDQTIFTLQNVTIKGAYSNELSGSLLYFQSSKSSFNVNLYNIIMNSNAASSNLFIFNSESSKSQVTMSYLNMIGGVGLNGGVIQARGPFPMNIDRSVFQFCNVGGSQESYESVIQTVDGTLFIDNSMFFENTGPIITGSLSSDSTTNGTITIQNTQIYQNKGSNLGVIQIRSYNLLATNVEAYENTANYGTVINCVTSPLVSLAGCQIYNNTAFLEGGFAYTNQSTLQINNTEVIDNIAQSGASIVCISSQINMNNATIKNNRPGNATEVMGVTCKDDHCVFIDSGETVSLCVDPWTPGKSSKSGKLTPGEIAGVVFGCIGGVILIGSDIARGVSDEQLKAEFSKIGEVIEAVVVRNKHTNETKGYGFVKFYNKSDVAAAIESKNPPTFRDSISGKTQVVKITLADTKNTLYIGHIPKGLSEKEIKDELEDISGCPIKGFEFDKKSSLYGYAYFKDHDTTIKAIKAIQKSKKYTASLTPAKKIGGDSKTPATKVLFVRGIKSQDEGDLLKSQLGPEYIEKIIVPLDSIKQVPIGHAFIYCYTTDDAKVIMDHNETIDFMGRKLSIAWGLPKQRKMEGYLSGASYEYPYFMPGFPSADYYYGQFGPLVDPRRSTYSSNSGPTSSKYESHHKREPYGSPYLLPPSSLHHGSKPGYGDYFYQSHPSMERSYKPLPSKQPPTSGSKLRYSPY